MKILPIINTNNSTPFYAQKGTYITKKFLEQKVKKDNVHNRVISTSIAGLSIAALNARLRKAGITYCDTNMNNINICSGYNQGFYTVKPTEYISQKQAKGLVLFSILKDNTALGGFNNYMEMVKDIKRQDIIQKGLKIHTYELNNNVPTLDAEKAAVTLGNFLNKDIKNKDLFFIEDDAFYYDNFTKTAYGLNMLIKNSDSNKETVLTCKFILNNKKNAIGYDCQYWDPYKWGSIDVHYTEQQTPSVKLKAIAEPENNKEFAEAFRFGNSSQQDLQTKNGIKNVLEHLAKRTGINNLTENMLQIVKFYSQDKSIKTRICYFDSTTGYSFVYTKDGKYLYQLEYNKDHEGNITACNRL